MYNLLGVSMFCFFELCFEGLDNPVFCILYIIFKRLEYNFTKFS